MTVKIISYRSLPYPLPPARTDTPLPPQKTPRLQAQTCGINEAKERKRNKHLSKNNTTRIVYAGTKMPRENYRSHVRWGNILSNTKALSTRN